MFRYNHVDDIICYEPPVVKYKNSTILEQRESWWSTCLKTFGWITWCYVKRKQDLNHTWLKRVSFFFGGDQSSTIPWNSNFLFALHSFIPWVLSSMFSLRVGFFCDPNRPFSSRAGGCSRVGWTSADTPAFFGVSSLMELKAKPPTVKSAPWPLCDLLRVRSRPSSLSDVGAINTANRLLSLTTSGEDERSVFSNTFLGVFRWRFVRDKKESGKWNATRDKSVAAMVIFVFSLNTRALAPFVPMLRAPKKNYIEPP